MIKVFQPTEKNYISNGDIVIKPLKAKVHKADNGDYYLDLETGLEYVDYLVEGNIIVAPTPQGEQAFRVTNPQKTRTRITVKAWHVFYDTKNYLIVDSFVQSKGGSAALSWLNNAAVPASPFTTFSDIGAVNSYRAVRKSLYEAIMEARDIWGGHLVRDNFSFGFMSDISQDNGVTVQYKKNLKSITVSENWDSVVTKILPVGYDGILLNAVNPSASIYITSTTQYEIPYTKVVSFEQDINPDDYPTEAKYKESLVADLKKQANAYLAENCVPKINYTLDAHLDKVTDIGDIIHVQDQRLNVNITTNVITYEYDCILKKYTQIEFGNFKPSLSGLLPTIRTDVKKSVNYALFEVNNELATKQAVLVSGSNIKTINGVSVLGSGDIDVGGGGGVLDYYPVGSYYETSDANFDPNISWGGTWELEASGQFHISAGTGYTIGDTGGSADAVVIQHSHAPSVTTEYFVTSDKDSANNTRVAYSSSGNRLVDGQTDTSVSSFHHRKYVQTVGSSGTGKNLPPYIVVNRWHRTA